MHDHSSKSSPPSITARPSAEEKARFQWLAERVGLSESALALAAIRSFLGGDRQALETATSAQERVARPIASPSGCAPETGQRSREGQPSEE